jgi:CD63 antigen
MGDALTGGAKCIKYLLFVFNLLFLLCGLALIVVGAIVQVQTKDAAAFNGSASSAGIFLIVVGSLIFIVCFFGCAGAINNNYCMVVTFGVLLLLILLAEVAAVIAGFVLKDKINETLTTEMLKNQQAYNPDDPDDIATQTWNRTQHDLKCCGTTDYMSWNESIKMKETNSVPDSCCKDFFVDCGKGKLTTASEDLFYGEGCHQKLMDYLNTYLVAVGIAAAVVAVIQLIGIIFAFCLANQLRKDYRVV